MKSKKSLLFGGSGFLGANLINLNNNFFSPKRSEVNLSDLKNTLNYISKLEPTEIIYLAGITKLDDAEENKELTFLLNHKIPTEIAKFSEKNNIKFIYTSTDAVFDGHKRRYEFTELDSPKPKSTYGKSKAKAEYEILFANPNACVLRLISLFGFGNRNLYLEKFIQTLNEKKEFLGIHDQIRNPLNVKIASESIQFSLDKNLSGIYHLGSLDFDTNLTFFKKIANYLKLDESLIKGISFNEFMKNKKAYRKKNSVLITNKFEIASKKLILKKIADSITYLNLK